MQNCYNSKVPKDVQDDQNDRLTTKHIHTLQFMQEIVEENKKLKERVLELEDQTSECGDLHELAKTAKHRIQEIQVEYLKRADEINALLLEKHKVEIMKRVEEKVEAEKEWGGERRKLLEEIDGLKRENVALRKEVEEYKQYKQAAEMLETHVRNLQGDLEQALTTNIQLETDARGQLKGLQKLDFLKDQNTNLKNEVASGNQKIKEMQYKISKLEREVGEVGAAEQEEAINCLRNKLIKTQKEKDIVEMASTNKDVQLGDLNGENEKLRHALNDSERMRMEMRTQTEQLKQELAFLKKQQASGKGSQTFKDFVQLKRELQYVKEENEELKIQVKFTSHHKKGSGVGLPKLKDGRERRVSHNAEQVQIVALTK